jgi:hypothetical protein
MNPAAARTSAPPPVVFRDGFGERRRIAAPTGGETLDVLCLRGELTAVPSFEFSLRERVSRLAGFRHPYFAQVRTVERLSDPARTLALISNTVPGVRLSELLATTAQHNIVLGSDAALCLIRQLVTAMATFHEQAPDAPHGALGPERVVVTPKARLVIVEHVLGAAVEQLQFSEDRLWRELRVPVPRSAGLPVIDQRADVLQLGMVALALMVRRPLGADEFHRLGDTLASAQAMTADGELEALPEGLQSWLTSALQLELRSAFATATEARRELEKVFERNDDIGAPSALEEFLTAYLLAVEAGVEPTQAAPTPKPSSAVEPVRPEPVKVEPAPQPPVRHVATIPPPQPAAEHAVAAPHSPPPAPLVNRSVEPVLPGRFEPSSLHEVPEDAAEEPAEMRTTARRGGRNRAAIAAIVLLLLAAGGTLAARRFFASPALTTGTVTVTTNPPGAQVILDGKAQGVSPMMLTVAAGAHVLELRGGGEPRLISLDVAAGAQLSQYIELGKGPVASGSGSLQVRTEPAGARISVDGIPRGVSPVTVPELPPGEHTVVVETDAGSTRQTVMVEAGMTASLVAQLPAVPGGPASGWISVNTPRSVQLFEGGRLLGSSDTERLMVPAGAHQLEIVNDAIGYRATKTVQVAAGKVSTIDVEFPTGTVALNATPWADVWIDGEKVGETPLGNLPVAIGAHEVIFRHPDFGEQRHVINVTLSAPVRLSVDMRKTP